MLSALYIGEVYLIPIDAYLTDLIGMCTGKVT